MAKKISKKAQGISVTVIIIAVVALVVLVVLIAVFSGKFGGFSEGVSQAGSCKGLGGDGCYNYPCSPNGNRIYGAIDCGRDLQEGNPYCCDMNPRE